MQTQSTKSTPIRYERKMVTPDLAQRILSRRDPNRNLKTPKINQFARAMLNGQWQSNGETVKFSQGKKLVDGQHRLTAVVRAGVPVEMDFAFGVPDEAVVTIDTGTKRTHADTLKMRFDAKNSALLSASLKLWWQYEHDLLTAKATPSHEELDAVYAAHPEIEDVTKVVTGSKALKAIADGSIVVFTYAKISELHGAAVAKKFWSEVSEGIGLTATSATLHLRNMLLANKTDKKKRAPLEILLLTIKAFNKWHRNEPTKNLRIRTGVRAEEQPRFL